MNKCKKKMDKSFFTILDDKSKPGYTKIKFNKSGRVTWLKNMDPKEYEKYEKSAFTYEQGKALGLLKGMKHKKFSELTKEEQKLFSDNDYYQENKNIW